jgi:hypothetical protein
MGYRRDVSATDGNLPPRPDAGASMPAVVAPTRRSSTTPIIVIAIVVGSILFVGVMLTLIVSAVDKVGQSAIDQFDQISYCMKHPHKPGCEVSFAPSP